MSNKSEEIESRRDHDSPLDALTSEAARQRWQLFHRAIAYAKQSNDASLEPDRGDSGETDATTADARNNGPALSVIR